MNKNEFLARLTDALKQNHILDTSDIVSEYAQHFTFKLADGFSEEEIAAKLGDPALLAAQFERHAETPNAIGRRLSVLTGLCLIDIFAGAFFILLFAWGAVMAVFSLACATLSVCLFGGLNPYALLPPMPYLCSLIFGATLLALAVLTAVGCIYFFAFLGQLLRSFRRFHHNTLAMASGRAALPSLAIHPQLAPKTNRRIRAIALTALIVFAACFMLGIIVAMFSAGSLSFWHAWGWFGYISA